MTPYQPEIRFADIDAMGHVNNAVYLSYFEQARIHFFRQMIGAKWDWKTDGLLVARNEIDYKRPILLSDRADIHVGCARIGEKSFTVTYSVRIGEEICATGSSVLVSFNHKLQQTQPVPAIWREALEKLIQQ